MSVKSHKELKRIMRSELCNRCGTCVALSEGKIVFTGREKKYRPRMIEELDDTEADRILNACAGKRFSFPEHREHFYPQPAHFHPYTGPYQNFYIGHSTHPEIRLNAGSGGILSAVLIFLLEKNMIDGAIVTRMSDEKPWLTEPFIAKTREEILEAAQSKYIITSVNEILAESSGFYGKLAYVGLPGQVQSIRKLQKAGDPSVANIKYIFGPFYGNTLYFSSVRSFIRSYGERDYRKIRKLWFRHGEWPGNMRVEMEDGKTFELKKFHANYLIPFHILKNSLFCTDLTNEFTDLSGGDAWSPDYEERGQGFSIIIPRSAAGQEIIETMHKEGWLEITPCTEEDAISMHSHGYDLKKRGSFIRIRIRKMFFRQIPDYGYKLSGFPISRYLMEFIISGLFLVLGSWPAGRIVELFKPALIGRLFEKSRTSWKKSTHSIKRKDLG
ncbi:Coenzyme F420 hydrogenase/dehydrogenase, beta subunit C-terminal domain [Bacteroidota bacterium]